MSKHRRRKVKRGLAGRVGPAHGRAWNEMEWYVPFNDGRAIIYHGHEDPDDHSECGPRVFCCPKAAHLLLQIDPSCVLADADWEFTEAEHLASWTHGAGPQIFYFFFCDPDDRTRLCFCGVPAPELREVLFKRLALDRYLEIADRICTLASE